MVMAFACPIQQRDKHRPHCMKMLETISKFTFQPLHFRLAPKRNCELQTCQESMEEIPTNGATITKLADWNQEAC